MRGSFTKICLLAVVGTVLTSGSPRVAAGEELEVVGAAAQVPLTYDDGETDAGVGPAAGGRIHLAMRFDAPAPGLVKSVSFCFRRSPGDAPDVAFGWGFRPVVAGKPGPLINGTGYGNGAEDIPAGAQGEFRTYPFYEPTPVPASFFVDFLLQDDNGDVELCEDTDSPQRSLFVATDGGFVWTDYQTIRPAVRAFMMRAVVEVPDAPAPCVDDTTTLACMLNDRFQVGVRYRKAFNEGPATTDAFRKDVVGFANPNFETAFFYFNSPNNIEVMVKILDQGNKNAEGEPTIAVLTGTATPLHVEVTVTDTTTGESKTYTSAYGTQAGKTDFQAFLE